MQTLEQQPQNIIFKQNKDAGINLYLDGNFG